MSEAEPQDLPRYPIQLRDAYLHEVTVGRRVRQDGDDAGPTLSAQASIPDLAPDKKAFTQIVSATVGVPFNEGQAVLDMTCSYVGVFGSSRPFTRKQVDAIAERTTTVLLWPFLRAGVAEIGRMTGVAVPQLPTIDVAQFVRDAPAPAKPRRTRKPAPKKVT